MRDWLAFGEGFGDAACPDWYADIVASDRVQWRVASWEWRYLPSIEKDRILVAAAAEAQARNLKREPMS